MDPLRVTDPRFKTLANFVLSVYKFVIIIYYYLSVVYLQLPLSDAAGLPQSPSSVCHTLANVAQFLSLF